MPKLTSQMASKTNQVWVINLQSEAVAHFPTNLALFNNEQVFALRNTHWSSKREADIVCAKLVAATNLRLVVRNVSFNKNQVRQQSHMPF